MFRKLFCLAGLHKYKIHYTLGKLICYRCRYCYKDKIVKKKMVI